MFYSGIDQHKLFSYITTVDSDGNVYVTGAGYDSITDYDYTTVKHDSAGVEQWVARYNGPGNDYDWANAIATDTKGNVYITQTIFLTDMSENHTGHLVPTFKMLGSKISFVFVYNTLEFVSR